MKSLELSILYALVQQPRGLHREDNRVVSDGGNTRTIR